MLPLSYSLRLAGLVLWDLQIWKIFPALWVATNAKGHYSQPSLAQSLRVCGVGGHAKELGCFLVHPDHRSPTAVGELSIKWRGRDAHLVTPCQYKDTEEHVCRLQTSASRPLLFELPEVDLVGHKNGLADGW